MTISLSMSWLLPVSMNVCCSTAQDSQELILCNGLQVCTTCTYLTIRSSAFSIIIRRPKLSSSMSSNHHHFQNEISMQLNTCFWLKGQDSYSWSFNTLYMQKRITSFKPKTRSHPSAAGLHDCFDIPQTYLFTYDLFTNCKLPPKKLLIGGSSANQENKGLPSTFQSGPAMLSQALLCDVAIVKRRWS